MVMKLFKRFVRGGASPLQILLASILGSMLAFVLEFARAPLWTLTLVAALLVLNASLGIAVLVAIPARLVAMVTVPFSFAVGRFLLDGPTRPLAELVVNAPVLAWFGFEYYATTGGAVVGLLFGLLSGLTVRRVVVAVRARLAELPEGSEERRRLAARPLARVVTLLVGGPGAGSRSPVRLSGAVAAALLIALVVAGVGLVEGPLVGRGLREGLGNVNGATVDVGDVELDLESGRLAIAGLALCDPGALSRDLFRAGLLEADLDTSDLARKRLTIDRLRVSDAVHDVERETPGELFGDPPAPEPPDEDDGWRIPLPDEKTLSEVLENYRVWQERLAQLRQWLEELAAEEDPAPDDKQSLREWLRRRVEERGYTRVAADHLIRAVPAVSIRELVVEGLTSTRLEGEVLDLVASNLSSHPGLLDEAPRISLVSRSGRVVFEAGLGQLAAGGGANGLRFELRGLPTGALADSLRVGGEPLLEGGTLDLALAGDWSAGDVGMIDLPLQVTLHDARLRLPELGATTLSELSLPLGLRGPIDDPRVTLDRDVLADALRAAGEAELAGRVTAAAEEKVDELVGSGVKKLEEKLGEELGGKLGGALEGEVGGAAKKALGGLFGDDDDD